MVIMVKLSRISLKSDLKVTNVSKDMFTSLYVDGENGLDSYSGDSWDEPLKTIQHAVDEAESGCKIYIKSMANDTLAVMASAGQKNVQLDSSDGFTVGDIVIVRSTNTTERATIASITGDVLTMSVNLTNTYAPVDDAVVIHVYDESVELKSGINIIGESSDTTIISTAAGNVLTYDVRVDNVEIQNVGVVCNQTDRAGMSINGKRNKIHDCEVDCAGTTGVFGVYCFGFGECEIWNIKNATPVLDYGVVISSNYNDVHDCTMIGVYTGIHLASGSESLVHDNLIDSCTFGIKLSGDSDENTIFHNNMLGNTDQIQNIGTGTANIWFENHFDNHVVDANHNGLSDTVYTQSGETDYKPVSVRNGWRQSALGTVAS